MDKDLLEMIEQVRSHKMSDFEYAEQRVAFAFGNAPHELKTTKEEVRTIINSASIPEASTPSH